MRGRLGGLLLPMILVTGVVSGMGPASARTAGRTHTVTIENMKFTPQQLNIQSGDEIVFVNKDLVPHTATAKPAELFNSGVMQPGESWSVRLKGTAPIRYMCILHPMMEGRIVFGADPP